MHVRKFGFVVVHIYIFYVYPFTTGVVAIAYASELPCTIKELEYDSDNTDSKEEEEHEGIIKGSSDEQENTESKQQSQVKKKDQEKEDSSKKLRRIFLKPKKPEMEKVSFTLVKYLFAIYCNHLFLYI